ncbi:Gfo/Idh/MocA family protein [Jiangella alba]|uniref:Predicted dehydrogenase n=1 Tax=Jiangella alba TaxID=561176 RepID=A0A1H5MEZ3_9ACTN|nr:Gfo/Idh/MocA family oxidoreductase [Jiangella alba]SEE87952.1 Predicted dehydrogenase [Jiangella alba]
MSEDSLPVVQVGCGDIATTGHLPALDRSPAVTLVGVVDVVAEHRDAAAAAYGVPAWTGLGPAVAAGARAAVVAVPPHVAPDLTLAAVDAGLDVLCEKPMAVDLASAQRVHDAARAAGRVVQIGFKNRFSPLVRAARRWLDDGLIGSPVVYTLGGFDERYDAADTLHTGRIQEFLEHGPSYLHEGAHLADYVAYLTGASPVRVRAAGLRSRQSFRGENFASTLVDYDNGDVARMEVGWFFPTSPKGEFRILGPRGVALIDRPEQVATLTTREDGTLRTEEVRFERPWNDECFDRQLAHFVECVRTRAEPETSTAAGLASLRIGAAVTESLREGTVVTW